MAVALCVEPSSTAAQFGRMRREARQSWAWRARLKHSRGRPCRA